MEMSHDSGGQMAGQESDDFEELQLRTGAAKGQDLEELWATGTQD